MDVKRRRNYVRKGIYSIEEVLSKIDSAYTMFDGDYIDMSSNRYKVFARSLSCVTCGLTGIHFAKEQSFRKKYLTTTNYTDPWHFNLYAFDYQYDKEVLMTKDHIIPKCRGGADDLANLQTMCSICNSRKGDQMPPVGQGLLNPYKKLSTSEIILFKRVFIQTLFDRLGWDIGEHKGHEEKLSYNRP